MSEKSYHRRQQALHTFRRIKYFDDLIEPALEADDEYPLWEFDTEKEASSFQSRLYRYRRKLADLGDHAYMSLMLSVRPHGDKWWLIAIPLDILPRKGRRLAPENRSKHLPLEERREMVEEALDDIIEEA